MTEENIVEWLKMKNAIRTYSHDDIGSARLLSDIFNKICRYNATVSEWYEFNGKYWAIDLGGLKVRNMTKILAKALIKYAVSVSEDDNKYLKYAATWNEHRKRNTIIQDARDLNFFKNEDCDIDIYILNCLNGVLVLHQDRVEFIKHDPDLLLTQIANVRYEPGKSCERWEKFIEEVMQGNQEKVRYLQKLFGICLTGDTRLEKMWFLFPRAMSQAAALARIFGECREGRCVPAAHVQCRPKRSADQIPCPLGRKEQVRSCPVACCGVFDLAVQQETENLQ